MEFRGLDQNPRNPRNLIPAKFNPIKVFIYYSFINIVLFLRMLQGIEDLYVYKFHDGRYVVNDQIVVTHMTKVRTFKNEKYPLDIKITPWI